MATSDFPMEKINLEDEVIVITGAVGFLAQHIIRVLNERSEGVKELRLLDIRRWERKLDYVESIRTTIFRADICDSESLDTILQGATAVIHTAGIFRGNYHTDRRRMFDVNVTGTANLLNKCLEHNVHKFVFTSSNTVNLRVDEMSCFNRKEEELPVPVIKPGKLLMGYCAHTKALAENLVHAAGEASGKKLKSAILRPGGMYGELDTLSVYVTLKSAAKFRGIFFHDKQDKDEEICFQIPYAGNVAWAHCVALQKLLEEEKNEEMKATSVHGNAYFILDNSKITSAYKFMKPFVEARGMRMKETPIPNWVVTSWLKMAHVFVKQLLPRSTRRNLKFHPLLLDPTCLQYSSRSLHFSQEKAKQILGYFPIYNPAESFELSMQYYLKVNLDD